MGVSLLRLSRGAAEVAGYGEENEGRWGTEREHMGVEHGGR